MSTAVATTIDDALARAVLYHTLSVGLQTPTTARFQEIGANDNFTAAVTALEALEQSGDGDAFHDAAIGLASTTVPDVDCAEGSFVRLFGHTARGLVSACETEYGPENVFNQPQQLADIAGYYLAFGLSPVTASESRVDHIACELEFMGFLSRKQAVLLDGRSTAAVDLETMEATERAERSFMRDHLGRFGRAFATRLLAEDRDGYFGALGQTLLALLTEECRRLGVEAGSVDLAVRHEEPDDTPMACGSADDQLIQIQRRPRS
jgi:putative dimethyl sulfoxide reductase chaperone